MGEYMFEVFEDGKTADYTAFPHLKYKSDKRAVFKTQEEAEFWANWWVYRGMDVGQKHTRLKLNVPVRINGLLMEIRALDVSG